MGQMPMYDNPGSVTGDLEFYYWILINLRQTAIIIILEHTMKFNVKVNEPANVLLRKP